MQPTYYNLYVIMRYLYLYIHTYIYKEGRGVVRLAGKKFFAGLETKNLT